MLCAALVIAIGIYPAPLFAVVETVGTALTAFAA